MTELFESQDISASLPVLKVVGLGGGGCNAINRMVELGISGIDFLAANTDYQALQTSLATQTIQLGPQVTRGLGAGGNPEIGRQPDLKGATREDRIDEFIDRLDLEEIVMTDNSFHQAKSLETGLGTV